MTLATELNEALVEINAEIARRSVIAVEAQARMRIRRRQARRQLAAIARLEESKRRIQEVLDDNTQ